MYTTPHWAEQLCATTICKDHQWNYILQSLQRYQQLIESGGILFYCPDYRLETIQCPRRAPRHVSSDQETDWFKDQPHQKKKGGPVSPCRDWEEKSPGSHKVGYRIERREEPVRRVIGEIECSPSGWEQNALLRGKGQVYASAILQRIEHSRQNVPRLFAMLKIVA